jgi:hypothetical protein
MLCVEELGSNMAFVTEQVRGDYRPVVALQ